MLEQLQIYPCFEHNIYLKKNGFCSININNSRLLGFALCFQEEKEEIKASETTNLNFLKNFKFGIKIYIYVVLNEANDITEKANGATKSNGSLWRRRRKWCKWKARTVKRKKKTKYKEAEKLQYELT